MIIKMYETLDSPNTINKTLSNELILDINLPARNEKNNLELILSGDFSDINYCLIPDFNRKYFIVNKIFRANNLTQIFLECDYIESFRDVILNSQSLFNREIREGDSYDGEIYVSPIKERLNFASNVSIIPVNQNVLSTVGVVSI